MLFFIERSYGEGCAGSGREGVRGLVDVLNRARGVLSRAVRPRRPLGQPVLRDPVLVVCGRARRTSRVVVRGRTGRAAVALVAVVRASGVPVAVGTAVVPLTA